VHHAIKAFETTVGVFFCSKTGNFVPKIFIHWNNVGRKEKFSTNLVKCNVN